MSRRLTLSDLPRTLDNHSVLSAPSPLPGEWPRPDPACFPAFRRARGLACALRPGDVLFIPHRWWHWVFSPAGAIALNLWTPAPTRPAPAPVGELAVLDAVPDDAALDRHRDGGIPFVLAGGARHWPAVRSWDEAHLARQVEESVVWILRSRSSHLVPVRKPGGPVDLERLPGMSFRDFLAVCATDGDRCYLGVAALAAESVLHAAIGAIPSRSRATEARVNLWYGSRALDTGLHFDAYDNLLVAVRGGRQVFLYPPSETPFLYARTLTMV